MTLTRSRRLSVALVLGAALALASAPLASSCHSAPASVVTPQGRAAFAGDQVVDRIGEAQSTVIDANKAGTVKDSFAVPFVKFTKAAVITVGQTPNGWLAAVSAAWGQFKANLSPADQQAYMSYTLLIDTILAAATPAPSSGGTNATTSASGS